MAAGWEPLNHTMCLFMLGLLSKETDFQRSVSDELLLYTFDHVFRSHGLVLWALGGSEPQASRWKGEETRHAGGSGGLPDSARRRAEVTERQLRTGWQRPG